MVVSGIFRLKSVLAFYQSIENLDPLGPPFPKALALYEVIPVPSALELTRDLKSFTLEGTTTPVAPWENCFNGESSVRL
jgi:hypothetical protein